MITTWVVNNYQPGTEEEARAMDAYKQAIVDGCAADIIGSNYFTGVFGNYLKPSVVRAGLDPDNLPQSDATKMSFGSERDEKPKAWKDIWGSGQGIGAVKQVVKVRELVSRLAKEYAEAKAAVRAA